MLIEERHAVGVLSGTGCARLWFCPGVADVGWSNETNLPGLVVCRSMKTSDGGDSRMRAGDEESETESEARRGFHASHP